MQSRPLAASGQSVTLEDQLTFGSQIAQGMAHLESKQVVHGRLSAFVIVNLDVDG
jgi:hypothetical protein